MQRIPLPPDHPHYAKDHVSGGVRVRPRSALLDRQPPTEGRITAFDKLHENLAVATEFYVHHGDGGRYGVYRALSETIDYLTNRGIPYACVDPLLAVMAAIRDADHGIASPIFEPTRSSKGGSPAKPVMQLQFEGLLAIVMECCVRHCRNEGMRPYIKPASQLAEKIIRESSWDISISAKQLKEIRERIQQSPADSPDRMEVDISLASEVAKANPLAWAKILLQHEWVNKPPKESA